MTSIDVYIYNFFIIPLSLMVFLNPHPYVWAFWIKSSEQKCHYVRIYKDKCQNLAILIQILDIFERDIFPFIKKTGLCDLLLFEIANIL